MTAGIQLHVTRNDFGRIAAELAPKISAVVVATTLEVEGEAKNDVAVLTGNLRRSLHSAFSEDLTHGAMGTDVEYAPYVEYGTSRMAAQPYVTPAVERARAPFLEAVRKVFDRA